MYNNSEVCFEKCRRIEAPREDTFKNIGWRLCHCLRCCVSEVCWAPAHDPWLTEWSRLHGYPIDDSLVSSAHPLGYRDNYFPRTTILTSTELLLEGTDSISSVHCAQNPDLNPTENVFADIKPDLSRNTPRNILEFEITIHDILN